MNPTSRRTLFGAPAALLLLDAAAAGPTKAAGLDGESAPDVRARRMAGRHRARHVRHGALRAADERVVPVG